VTLFTNGSLMLEASVRRVLWDKDADIEETRIKSVEATADIHLSDGRCLTFAGLFIATRTVPTSLLVANSGCVVEEAPIGGQILTDATKQTSVPGIYACGDVASMPHSVSLAVGGGAMAGMLLHRSLVWPDAY